MSFKFFEDSRGEYVASPAEAGELPKIFVSAEIYPAAYELAILALNKHGTRSRTHYDKRDTDGNYLHPPSIEANVAVEVRNPLKEPRGHLMIPGDYRSLESYRQEVVDGIHDAWIKPKEGKWIYTYHDRIVNWNPFRDAESMREDKGRFLTKGINQIEEILRELEKEITSKAAQAITWYPTSDPRTSKDRPCLQSLWFRVLENKSGEYVLNLNSRWRSRDGYKAWPMNAWAVVDWFKEIGGMLADRIKEPITIGTYRDMSDSLHIYGAYTTDWKFQNEIEKMRNPDMKGRVFNSNDEIPQYYFNEARENLKKDPDYYAKGGF